MSSPENTTPVRVDVMKLKRNRLRLDIEKKLKNLKVNVLKSEAILELFEVTEHDVMTVLGDLRLQVTTDNLVKVLKSRVKEFNVEQLQNIDSFLLLYKTAYFSKHFTWSTLSLLEPDRRRWSTDVQEIRINLQQALRIKSMNALIKVILHDDLVWILLIEKKLSRKGLKFTKPVIFCYEVDVPYVFFRGNIPASIKECLLKAMNFKKQKIHNLTGKDIKSLLTLLKNKHTADKEIANVRYEPGEAEAGHRHLDFSNVKARKVYAKKVLSTKEPVVLETFTVQAMSIWPENDLVPEMAGETFPMSMTLKSKNIVNLVQKMVENDMLAVPIPEYMQEILRAAKNKITIRSQGVNNNP